MSEMEQDSMKRREGRTELWLLLLIWLLRCTCNRTILCFPFDERRKWFTCNCYFPTDLLIAPTLGGWPDQLLMASSPSQSLGTAAIRLRAVSLGRECKLKLARWETATDTHGAARPAVWPLEPMQIAVSCTLTRSRSAWLGWCYGFAAAEVTSASPLTGKQACRKLAEWKHSLEVRRDPASLLLEFCQQMLDIKVSHLWLLFLSFPWEDGWNNGNFRFLNDGKRAF